MFRVADLNIKLYRNVEPTHLKFSQGINVFLGKNGTGKTALLNLLEQIVTDDFSATEDEPVHYHTTLKPSADAGEPIEIIFESAPGSPPLDSPPEVRAAARVVESRLQASSKYGSLDWRGAAGALRATIGDDLVLPNPRSALHLLRVHNQRTEGEPGKLGPELAWVNAASEAPGRLDEGLDVFRGLTNTEETALTLVTMDVPGLENAHRFVSDVRRRQIGPTLLAALDKSDSEEPRWTDEEDEALGTFVKLCGFSRAEAFTRLLESNPLGEDVVVSTFGGLGFRFHSRDGSRSFGHARLSFGQKRLLALLYHAHASAAGGPFLADELVNGLHYDWIGSIMETLGNRQSFLTSQNPILLDQITGLKDVEMVRRTFITCRTSDDEKRLVWANITKSDAEEFVRNYSSGLAHVSEVLRDLDLW